MLSKINDCIFYTVSAIKRIMVKRIKVKKKQHDLCCRCLGKELAGYWDHKKQQESGWSALGNASINATYL